MATLTTSGLFAPNVFGDYAIDWENDVFKMASTPVNNGDTAKFASGQVT